MAKTDTTPPLNDEALELFFEAARSEVACPPEAADSPAPGAGLSPALRARILDDAARVAAAPAPAPALAPAQNPAPNLAPNLAPKPAPAPAAPSLWRSLTDALGGWPAFASIASAAVVGVGLGFAGPAPLTALAGGLFLPTSPAAEATGATNRLEDMVPGFNGFGDLSTEVSG